MCPTPICYDQKSLLDIQQAEMQGKHSSEQIMDMIEVTATGRVAGEAASRAKRLNTKANTAIGIIHTEVVAGAAIVARLISADNGVIGTNHSDRGMRTPVVGAVCILRARRQRMECNRQCQDGSHHQPRLPEPHWTCQPMTGLGDGM